MHYVHVLVVQLLGGNSLAVKGNRQAQRAVQPVYPGRLVVAGVLHRVGEVVPEQLHQQIVEVFRPGADDYAVRRNIYSPVGFQVRGDSLL